MNAAFDWQGRAVPPEPPTEAPAAPNGLRADLLPQRVVDALWRANELGSQDESVVASGHPRLDAELPGGGWPCKAVTEILQPQPGVLEWRLLGPALRGLSSKDIVLVGPPRQLHAGGLVQAGFDERRLVWIRAVTPAERLWCAEQLVKAGSCAALVAWLPQARPEQVRRLQVCAQSCSGPVFLCRPSGAQHEASASPLRVLASVGIDWDIDVRIVKRRGPVHDGLLHLAAVPGTLASVLTPRMKRPSRIASRPSHQSVPFREAADAVGSAASPRHRRHAAAS